MESTMIFGISPIFALLPLIIYIILAFKDINPVLNVVICVVLSAIMTKQPFSAMGGVLADSIGSFLGMIGFIIMLGSALGAVLKETGVAEFLIMALMHKIGIDSEKKAIIASMITSIVVVALLGTLAGANAIIAPLIIPLVAIIGLTPSTMAAVLMGAGITGLFIGPYSPQVVTIMSLTGMTYGNYFIQVGLPVAALCWITTFVCSIRIQNKTRNVYKYEDVEEAKTDYSASPEAKRATAVFFACMVLLIGYGIYLQSGSSYAILVISVTAIITGLAGGIHPDKLFDVMIEGASRMMWLFIMFVLFTPFIGFVSEAGAFDALVKLIEPLLRSNSKIIVSLITALTGIFGVGGAAAAQSVVMDSMFKELVNNIGMSTGLWATVLLVGSQITSFAYPEADMLGQMGLARSKDLKNMVKFGVTITIVTIIYVGVRAIFG
ncbi:Na+/H+ antiporter NhaC family protein [[Clostridium] symbiosum]|uniref:GntT/GntP/DsdX family permease n=1 Tax=Clostridium symbiosum TaxID=1512 RepID=UPI001D096998|nr:Na+/H+ antiporter NhaC family protein [[Clostridium] symbiosum]MCB6609076.1 citrate transporter [[Clostridium] symbiosum]MCB6930501.1 citrate transporter [[Clostridium] symbiosum]